MKPASETTRADSLHFATLERIRSHWLSNLSHDSANCLFALRGYLRMVADRQHGELTEVQRRYLAAALENVAELMTLAKELKNFPQPDGFKFVAVNLGSLLREVIEGINGELAANKVYIAEAFGGLLPIMADRDKLAAAVRNVLTEAVKLTGRGGRIDIDAREENERIVLQHLATRDPLASELSLPPQFRVASAIARLHGGEISFHRASENAYVVTLEMPLIRTSECYEQGLPG